MVSNVKRTERSRNALINAARALFAQDGYAETSTPRITEEAGLSRGALYHHFGDKLGLFRAVIEAEQDRVTAAISAVPFDDDDPVGTIIVAGEGFLDAMRDAGARRLLYVEGSSVLGEQAMREIDVERGGQTLAMAIEAAIESGVFRPLPVRAMADLMSAAYDRAAVEGTPEHRLAIRELVEGLRVRDDPRRQAAS